MTVFRGVPTGRRGKNEKNTVFWQKKDRPAWEGVFSDQKNRLFSTFFDPPKSTFWPSLGEKSRNLPFWPPFFPTTFRKKWPKKGTLGVNYAERGDLEGFFSGPEVFSHDLSQKMAKKGTLGVNYTEGGDLEGFFPRNRDFWPSLWENPDFRGKLHRGRGFRGLFPPEPRVFGSI